jgi:hypothetical protein
MRIWPALAFASFAACGGSSSPATPDGPDTSADAAPDASTGFQTAPHDPGPTVVPLGGPVMTSPKIVPIFFTGDSTMQGQVEPYLQALVGSTYWTATTAEYGIGNLAIQPTIVSTDAAPTTDDNLKTWLSAQTDGTHAGWPAPDGNTLYAVFLPSGVSISTPFGDSCSAFGGYHNEGTTSGGGKLIYALLPRCSPSIDEMTVVTSHELVEAVTDPYPFTQGAYQQTDDNHLIWSFTPGGELGDMCEYMAEASQRLVGNYAVQRTWSNASAAAGHDPCVPVMQTPYLGASPVLTDAEMLDLQDGTGLHATKGVQIAAGSSKTIEVDLFSDADAPDWTVKASDASSLTGGGNELSFSWDKTTGHNGDKLHLTITHVAAGQNGGSEFVISSRVNNRSVSLFWGYVAN